MTMRFVSLLLSLSVVAAAEWVSIGPDGGHVQALAIDPGNAAKLVALAYEYPENGRVFRSRDGGASWTAMGRFIDIYASKAAIDPHAGNMVYVMGRGDAMFISSDSGATWASRALPNQAFDFVCDPHVPGRLFAVGYWLAGSYWPAVFISTDRGQSWATRFPDSTAMQVYATAVACDPLNPGVVYVGTTDSIVYRSTDAGETWSRRCSGLPPNAGIASLSVNPGNSDIVLAGAGTGMYRTADAGQSWSPVAELLRAYAVSFAAAAQAYALAYDTTMRVFFSGDSGRSWQAASPGMALGKGEAVHTVPQNPDLLYLNGMMGVFRSTDRGNNWSAAHAGMRFAHISTVAACPGHPERLYLEVSENGVYKSEDGGLTWTRCEDFLACGNICAIGVVPGTYADVLYALEGSG